VRMPPVTFTIRSVNTGMPRDREWAGIGYTSIETLPVSGPVRVDKLGLEGDQVSDVAHHGGVDQAVYAFAREDLDAWVEVLGEPIRDGLFGENLTTLGYDVNEAEIGERWRVGSTVLEVASIRIPCNDFKGWIGENGFDNTSWVKRFSEVGRPGPYLRVVEEGVLQAGDTAKVIHRPGHGVTVSTMFRALSCCSWTPWSSRPARRPSGTSRP
jgi:MOSC domain-containing protein YiiM